MSKKQIEVDGVGELTLTRRSGIKSIRVRINHDGEPEVSAPRHIPVAYIKRFIRSKKDWIRKHSTEGKPLSDGDKIGNFHLLSVSGGTSFRTSIRGNNIRATIPASSSIQSDIVQNHLRKASVKALRKESNELFPERVRLWADSGTGEYKKLSIKNMKTRWGSYTSKGGLNLSLYLVQAPQELVDYVIVHELCHSAHMNHSDKFWKNVEKYIPDYKQRRKELHKHRMTVTPH